MAKSAKDKCVSDEMHQWKHEGLHSGTGVKGKKGPEVPKTKAGQKQAVAIALSVCSKKTADHSERLQALGFSEEAAALYAETMAFIESKRAAEEVDEGPLSDIDSRPGKQKPQTRTKQDQQGSVATFPTLPKEGYAEGKFIKAKNKKCPPGTKSVGGGFCKNPKAGSREYFDAGKNGCPPGSRAVGNRQCRADYAEPENPLEGECNQKEKRERMKQQRSPEQRQADEERARQMSSKPPQVPSSVRKEAAEKAAKTRARCKGSGQSSRPALG